MGNSKNEWMKRKMPVNFERFKHFPKEAAFLHDNYVVGRRGNANHEDKNRKFTENRNKKTNRFQWEIAATCQDTRVKVAWREKESDLCLGKEEFEKERKVWKFLVILKPFQIVLSYLWATVASPENVHFLFTLKSSYVGVSIFWDCCSESWNLQFE